MNSEVKSQIIEIIQKFEKNVLNKPVSIISKKGHDGAAGHALEDLFQLKRSKVSGADFGLIELKIDTPKTTLGDWSPDLGEYHIGKINPPDGKKGKRQYLEDYGVKNAEGKWHVTGPYYGTADGSKNHLRLVVKNKNLYLFDLNKNIDVIGWSYESLKQRIDKKFSGGMAVPRIANGVFIDLDFYIGFDIDRFYQWIKDGVVIYDPGTSMKRPYSQFRFRGKDSMSSLKCTNYKILKKELF